ncbi:MAG: enoyl-CoA hydratase [Micropepsaceae bacterium]
MSTYEDILFSVEDGIALITLNRPDRLNAWTAAMQASVKRAMVDASRDDRVRAIVVTGAGRGFCAGADMAGLQQIQPGKWNERSLAKADESVQVDPRPDLGPDVSREYAGRFGYIMSIRKPVIAAINGACAGIGLVFTLYCDMRFAASSAVFTTSFAQRGLIAEHGISWLLPRIVGTSSALDLLFSARKVKADEAERLGLVNRTFAADTFMDEVRAYAKHLVQNVSPRATAIMKAQVWKSLFQDLNEAIRIGDEEMQKSFGTEDFKEGVAHFVEKRPAKFTGR